MVESKIILASKNAYTEKLIVTYQIKCPVWVWYDILTHRAFSRNASSTRAIPCATIRERTLHHPGIPSTFMKAQKGMEANEPLSEDLQNKSKELFNLVLNGLVSCHSDAEQLGMSKQDANVLLLPFIQFDAIITSTDWENFFYLRNNNAAKPELHILADKMQSQYNKIIMDENRDNLHAGYNCWKLESDEWHMPYTNEIANQVDFETRQKISVAKCARVSYGTENLSKVSINKDIELHDRLLASGHYSPFEHIATPLVSKVKVDNFNSWLQYRAFVETPKDQSYKPITREQALIIYFNQP